jgi:hypothetical protein
VTVTLEIPDDLLARLRREAESRGLSLDQWLLEIAEERAVDGEPDSEQAGALEAMFAKARGFADDLDMSRDPSSDRDVVL